MLPFRPRVVFKRVNAATAAANDLPAAEVWEGCFWRSRGRVVFMRLRENCKADKGDYEFFATSLPDFRQRMARLGADLLALNNAILKHQRPLDPAQVHSADELQDRIGEVVDELDGMLENADAAFDEVRGITTTATATTTTTTTAAGAAVISYASHKTGGITPTMSRSAPGSPAVATTATSTARVLVSPSTGGTERKDFRFMHANNVLRPQLKFADTIDNGHLPFVPILREKFFAKTPLNLEAYESARAAHQQTIKTGPLDTIQHRIDQLGECLKLSFTPFPNPYTDEIRSIAYRSGYDQPCKEQVFRSLQDTPVTWVDTEEQLDLVVRLLESAVEFAVDLEGFLCLMQVSTRTEDFLIDTIALRAHMHKLARAFANPNIVKVFHGADSDVAWLQRDFGIYIVNLFDTGQAARVLEYPSFGLAYLLQQFASVTADKKYQLADWRIRPLPEEMFRYAREDTHYLLYIYDRMRNELLAKSNSEGNMFWSAIRRSEEVALKVYEKEMFDPDAALALHRKYNRVFSSEQLEVLRVLHAWRDITARQEDESARYVLPNHMLLHMTEVMPLNVSTVVASCAPVPPLVRLKAAEIAALVHATRQKAINIPSLNVASTTSETSAGTPVATKHVTFSGVPLPTLLSPASHPQHSMQARSISFAPQRAVSTMVTVTKRSASAMFDCDEQKTPSVSVKLQAKSTMLGRDDVDEEDEQEQELLRQRASAVLKEIARTPMYPTMPTVVPAASASTATAKPPTIDTMSAHSPVAPSLPAPLSQRKRKAASDDDTLPTAASTERKTQRKAKNTAVPDDGTTAKITPVLGDEEIAEKLQQRLTQAQTPASGSPTGIFDPYSTTVVPKREQKGLRSPAFTKSGSRSSTFIVGKR